MKQNKFTDIYFKDLQFYENKYGPKTIVFIEKGKFMEMYGIENDTETIGHLSKICDILQISCTRANNKIDGSNNRDNPLMAGIPSYAIDNHIEVLLQNNYTVVMKTQTKKVGDTFEREVTAIHSNGCYIKEKMSFESSNIVCMITNKHTHYQTKKPIVSIGLSLIDITTGNSVIYEVCDKPNNTSYALNEAYRFIQIAKPKQVIMILHDNDIIKSLELQENQCRILDRNKNMETLNYQKQFFSQIYPDEPNNIMEYLGLTRCPSATSSFMYCLNYVYEHNKTFMNHLKKPVYWNKTEHMTLHHNTIYQLDLVSNEPQKQTLCQLLNKCHTHPGKRLFQHWLLNPSTNKEVIQQRYNMIENMLNHEKDLCKFIDMLKTVYDIERLFRRISIGVLRPFELFKIYKSLISIQHVIKLIEKMEIKGFSYNSDNITDITAYIKNTFNLKLLETYTNTKTHITYNIYNSGIHDDIDEIQKEYDNTYNELLEYINTLDSCVETGKDGNFFKLKNEKKGYCLEITKVRFAGYLKAIKLQEDKEDKYIKFEKTATNSTYKLTNTYINGINKKLFICTERLNELTDAYYYLHIKDIDEKYEKYYNNISTFIATFDVILNNSLMAIKNIYTKPEIVDSDISFINSVGLRHPIVEQINRMEKYVPNDINIGQEEHGIILFGMNASGKSVCLKATGIAIIMAQAGMYVASKKFEYSIYNNVLSRILGNDNLMKSLSSFEVEMIELKNILDIADSNSLVLGDEICRGTEHISGLSLVAASIMDLAKRNTSFMYTTHLHKLSDLQCIKELNNVGIYHLRVNIDGDKIIYDRTIQKGNGETIYGIEVARAMNMNADFIKNAYEIRGLLVNKENKILSEKRSIYNKNIIVDKCEICQEKGVDTHHIQFQCTAVNNKIEHFHKNVDHNLVVLCKKCHQDVHSYKYEISGWDTGVNSRTLRYKKLNKKEREDYKKTLNIPPKPTTQKNIIDFY